MIFAVLLRERHKRSRHKYLHVHTSGVKRLPKLSHAVVSPATLSANEPSDLSKQGVTSSSMYVTRLRAGVWSYSLQASLRSANLLHRSSVLQVERGGETTSQLPAAMGDHIRQQMNCSEGRPPKTRRKHIKLIAPLR